MSGVDLDSSIAHLRTVELKLMDIDVDELNQEEKSELAKQINECTTSILRLVNADMENLAAEFEARESELRLATKRLEDDLRDLNDAGQVIDVVSAGLKTVTEIAGLLIRHGV